MLLNSAYQYQLYEMAHAALAPARAFSDATYFLFRNPFNPLTATPFGRNMAAGAELFERHDAPLRQADFRLQLRSPSMGSSTR